LGLGTNSPRKAEILQSPWVWGDRRVPKQAVWLGQILENTIQVLSLPERRLDRQHRAKDRPNKGKRLGRAGLQTRWHYSNQPHPDRHPANQGQMLKKPVITPSLPFRKIEDFAPVRVISSSASEK